MAELRYLVSEDDDGQTAETLFRKKMALSRHMLSRLKFTGGLTLDGEPVHTDRRCRSGQVLAAAFPDSAPAWEGLKGYRGTLQVVYEDEHLMVVDKTAPLATLASPRGDGNSLEAAVYHYLGESERFTFRPVNRLDKGTGGLMAIAMHPQAQDALQKQLHKDMMREYLAVTEGIPVPPAGTVDLPIGKESPSSVRRVITPDGKNAVTRYRTVRICGRRALVRLSLLTGRTHQIRVHLKAIHCPVAGDYLYGTPLPELPGRFALHSCDLTLRHPVTGERLHFESPLPPELERLLV